VRWLGLAALSGSFVATPLVNAQAPVVDYLATNESFDATSNTWTTKSPMPTPRLNLAVGEVNRILYAIELFRREHSKFLANE
jgi:hypothetical protein